MDYNIKEAIDARRLHHQVRLVAEIIINPRKLFIAETRDSNFILQFDPMTVNYEPRFNEAILSYLREIGHKTMRYSYASTMTAIAQKNGQITANSDWRRQGTVSGF